MRQQENEHEFNSNEHFMKSVYSKVSDLRSILRENQLFENQDKNNIIKNLKVQNQNELLHLIKPQTSVKPIKINEQSKINRQKIITNQRAKNQSLTQRKMAKTFSTLPFHNKIKISRNQVSSSPFKQSLNPFQYRSIKNITLNSENLSIKNKNESKSQKKLFSSTQIVKLNIQALRYLSKQEQNKLLKDRNENKMTRILGFLDKNSKSLQKSKNKMMKQMKEMTLKRQKTRSQIKNFNLNDEIQSQKDQQFQHELEQNQFKPIGSAKTQRRPLKLHDDISFQKLSVINSERMKKLGQQQVSIVEKKYLNHYKNSGERKTYLQKGNRLREILYKKLSKQSSSQGRQMVYVREYDQWVPSQLVQNNKKQLQIYLQLLLGEKKQNRSKKITLNQAQIFYY